MTHMKENFIGPKGTMTGINTKQKFVRIADVRKQMTKPKTKEEKEQIENLISIREDLWSGEKTREEILEELNLDSEYSEHCEKFFKGKK